MVPGARGMSSLTCRHRVKVASTLSVVVLCMVVFESDLCSPLYWLQVWSNDGHRMDDAGVVTIPHNEVSL